MKRRVLAESILAALLLAGVVQTAIASESGTPTDIQGGFALNRGEVDVGSSNASALPGGLPIILATGNLVISENDFASGGQMGLSLTRTYNHLWDGIGIFGSRWQSNFDYKISFNTSASTDPCYPKPGGNCATPPTNAPVLWAHLPDGRRIRYLYNATSKIWLEDKPAAVSSIVLNSSDGSYTLYNENHGVETYDAHGYVVSLKTEQGVGWTFAYDANHYLQTVTHTSGRKVKLAWFNGLVHTITDPNLGVYVYDYTTVTAADGSQHAVLGEIDDPTNGARFLTYNAPTGSTSGYDWLWGESEIMKWGKYGNDYSYGRSFTYDANGRANAITSGGGTYSVVYDTSNGIANPVTTVTNPLGRVTVYTYNNYLLTGTSASGGVNAAAATTTTGYDSNSWPNKFVDPNGNTALMTFSANGEMTQQVEASGTAWARTTNYTWDPDPTRPRKTAEVVVGDHEIDYAYGPDQRLKTATAINLSANGVAGQKHTTTYTYTANANGLLTSMTVAVPLGSTVDSVTTRYNATGDVATVTDSLGHTTTYSSYNGFGQPQHVVGVNGATTDYTYDARGRLTKAVASANGGTATTYYSYDMAGKLTNKTMPDGSVYRYFYDPFGRLANSEHDAPSTLAGGATGEESDFTYDAMGNVVRQVNSGVTGAGAQDACVTWVPDGDGGHECVAETYSWVSTPLYSNSHAWTFDGVGRLWKSTGNASQLITNNYDSNDNLLNTTDKLGHKTSFAYDALNRLWKTTAANTGITSLLYDAANRVTSVTDPKGLLTSYTYDGFGQLLKQVSKDTGTTSFVFDSTGLRTSMTRNDGTITNYGYDGLGRETSIAVGTSKQVLTYDNCTNGKGLFCGYSDTFGTTTDSLTNTYTPEGWLASQSSTIAGSPYSTSYVHDLMGHTTALTYADGVVANYTWKDSKVSAITATVNGVTVPVASTVLYEQLGPETSWTNGNGLITSRPFDSDGRLIGVGVSSLSANIVQSLTLGYDPADRITGISNPVVAGQTQSIGYDAMDRVNADSGSAIGTWGWGYDVDSNRTTSATPTGALTYNNTNNLITSLSGASTRAFSYDKNGNRLTDTGSNGTLGFHYDPFNRMDSATKNGVTTSYHVDPLGERIYKSTSPSVWTHFLYGGGNALLSENSNTGMTDYVYLDGAPIAMVRGGKVDMIHTDQVGRPEVVTDSTQAVVWRASNTAFDRTILQDGIGGLNIGFPGQYYDSETGLWNNGFRDYDASVGRYVESDPMGLNAGINTFAYVGGNPLDAADPMGLTKAGKLIGWGVGQWFGATYGTEFGAWGGGLIGEGLDPFGGGVPGSLIGAAAGRRFGGKLFGIVGATLGDSISDWLDVGGQVTDWVAAMVPESSGTPGPYDSEGFSAIHQPRGVQYFWPQYDPICDCLDAYVPGNTSDAAGASQVNTSSNANSNGAQDIYSPGSNSGMIANMDWKNLEGGSDESWDDQVTEIVKKIERISNLQR